jgi:hypothetical protein
VIPGFHHACTSDSDCAIYQLTCSPTGLGCIECMDSVTCSSHPGEVCSAQGACAVVACLDQAACPAGTTCDTAARRCVSTASGTGGVGGAGTGGFNSGGITGTGGFNVGGGTTGGAGGTGPGPDYLVIGGWHGYVWDSVNLTGSITPTSFATATPGGPYCATGSVAADPAFGGVGIVGWNINQPVGAVGTDPPLDVVFPSGTSLTVNFTNNGTSPLRVQIQGLNGATDANDRWCYDISTYVYGPITIPFSSFNTTCWDNLGSYYAGQGISAAMLLVPGNDALATSFNICLSGFSEN